MSSSPLSEEADRQLEEALQRLRQGLQQDPLVEKFRAIAQELALPLYLVGGYPRDLLLGFRSLDYDLVVVGPHKKVVQRVAETLQARPQVHEEFMTARIEGPGNVVVDVVRARRERYPRPGALPRVEPTFDLREDLARRDFTINAVAVQLNPHSFGQVIDLFDGVADIVIHRRIRVLHKGSFTDDPTRAFRAIRYRLRFGFRYDPLTLEEFEGARDVMPAISFARIKHELKRTAEEERRAEMFHEIHAFGLLSALDPRLFAPSLEVFRLLHRYLGEPEASHWIAFFALFFHRGAPRPEDLDLELTREERRILELFLEHLDTPVPENMEELHRRFKGVPDLTLYALAAFRGEPLLAEYAFRRKAVHVALTSEELMGMGVPAGKELGEIKEALFVGHLTDRLHTREEEAALVEEYLKEHKCEGSSSREGNGTT